MYLPRLLRGSHSQGLGEIPSSLTRSQICRRGGGLHWKRKYGTLNADKLFNFAAVLAIDG